MKTKVTVVSKIISYYFVISILSTNNAFSHEIEEQVLMLKNNEFSYRVDFTDPKEEMHWRATNDGVMGGLSQGLLLFSGSASIFSGVISTENKGGFSSVYKDIQPLPERLHFIEIDVQGDGLIYQLRLVMYVNGYRLAYKHDFITTLGQRERIKFKLSDFKASFRGRHISGAPKLKSEDIRETGFLLSRQEAGKFSLTLYKLEIYSNSEA